MVDAIEKKRNKKVLFRAETSRPIDLSPELDFIYVLTENSWTRYELIVSA